MTTPQIPMKLSPTWDASGLSKLGRGVEAAVTPGLDRAAQQFGANLAGAVRGATSRVAGPQLHPDTPTGGPSPGSSQNVRAPRPPAPPRWQQLSPGIVGMAGGRWTPGWNNLGGGASYWHGPSAPGPGAGAGGGGGMTPGGGGGGGAGLPPPGGGGMTPGGGGGGRGIGGIVGGVFRGGPPRGGGTVSGGGGGRSPWLGLFATGAAYGVNQGVSMAFRGQGTRYEYHQLARNAMAGAAGTPGQGQDDFYNQLVNYGKRYGYSTKETLGVATAIAGTTGTSNQGMTNFRQRFDTTGRIGFSTGIGSEAATALTTPWMRSGLLGDFAGGNRVSSSAPGAQNGSANVGQMEMMIGRTLGQTGITRQATEMIRALGDLTESITTNTITQLSTRSASGVMGLGGTLMGSNGGLTAAQTTQMVGSLNTAISGPTTPTGRAMSSLATMDTLRQRGQAITPWNMALTQEKGITDPDLLENLLRRSFSYNTAGADAGQVQYQLRSTLGEYGHAGEAEAITNAFAQKNAQGAIIGPNEEALKKLHQDVTTGKINEGAMFTVGALRGAGNDPRKTRDILEKFAEPGLGTQGDKIRGMLESNKPITAGAAEKAVTDYFDQGGKLPKSDTESTVHWQQAVLTKLEQILSSLVSTKGGSVVGMALGSMAGGLGALGIRALMGGGGGITGTARTVGGAAMGAAGAAAAGYGAFNRGASAMAGRPLGFGSFAAAGGIMGAVGYGATAAYQAAHGEGRSAAGFGIGAGLMAGGAAMMGRSPLIGGGMIAAGLAAPLINKFGIDPALNWFSSHFGGSGDQARATTAGDQYASSDPMAALRASRANRTAPTTDQNDQNDRGGGLPGWAAPVAAAGTVAAGLGIRSFLRRGASAAVDEEGFTSLGGGLAYKGAAKSAAAGTATAAAKAGGRFGALGKWAGRAGLALQAGFLGYDAFQNARQVGTGDPNDAKTWRSAGRLGVDAGAATALAAGMPWVSAGISALGPMLTDPLEEFLGNKFGKIHRDSEDPNGPRNPDGGSPLRRAIPKVDTRFGNPVISGSTRPRTFAEPTPVTQGSSSALPTAPPSPVPQNSFPPKDNRLDSITVDTAVFKTASFDQSTTLGPGGTVGDPSRSNGTLNGLPAAAAGGNDLAYQRALLRATTQNGQPLLTSLQPTIPGQAQAGGGGLSGLARTALLGPGTGTGDNGLTSPAYRAAIAPLRGVNYTAGPYRGQSAQDYLSTQTPALADAMGLSTKDIATLQTLLSYTAMGEGGMNPDGTNRTNDLGATGMFQFTPTGGQAGQLARMGIAGHNDPASQLSALAQGGWLRSGWDTYQSAIAGGASPNDAANQFWNATLQPGFEGDRGINARMGPGGDLPGIFRQAQNPTRTPAPPTTQPKNFGAGNPNITSTEPGFTQAFGQQVVHLVRFTPAQVTIKSPAGDTTTELQVDNGDIALKTESGFL